MPSLPPGFRLVRRGRKKAVLLLHGMSSSPWEMSSLAKELFRKGWDVTCPLLADFNLWESRFGEFTWSCWSDRAESEFARLEARYSTIVVAGTSLGGILAALLCIRHPRIRLAVLVNPPFRYRNPLAFLGMFFYRLFPGIRIRVAEKFRSKYYPIFPMKAVLELYRLGRIVMTGAKKIGQPVLVLSSGSDRTVARSGIVAFLDRISSTRKELKIVPNAPHSLLAPWYKNNSFVFREIAGFFGGVK